MPWTKKHLEYALTQVPKEKLSLGIPSYGYRWFTGNPVRKDGTENSNISGTYIDADKSFPLAIAQKANVQWDPIEQESWFYFYRDNMREWVSRPDAHSFRARYDLVKQNGLQGFSCWVLGAEDPKCGMNCPSPPTKHSPLACCRDLPPYNAAHANPEGNNRMPPPQPAQRRNPHYCGHCSPCALPHCQQRASTPPHHIIKITTPITPENCFRPTTTTTATDPCTRSNTTRSRPNPHWPPHPDFHPPTIPTHNTAPPT